MLKILAIGNSFSNDATVYLHDMAKKGGEQSKIVNLYIGGCSLETHMMNIDKDLCAYKYELNGSDTGRLISVKDAIAEDCWDIITVQQASHFSGLAESYHPYFEQLIKFIRRSAPNAKIYIHETWSYESDSDHPDFYRYDKSQTKMYDMLKAAYSAVANEHKLPIIPCGDVIQALRKTHDFDYSDGGISLCRDGYHMNLTFGRYAVSATWYETLFGGSILENDYLPPDVTDASDFPKYETIRKTVHKICSK